MRGGEQEQVKDGSRCSGPLFKDPEFNIFPLNISSKPLHMITMSVFSLSVGVWCGWVPVLYVCVCMCGVCVPVWYVCVCVCACGVYV